MFPRPPRQFQETPPFLSKFTLAFTAEEASPLSHESRFPHSCRTFCVCIFTSHNRLRNFALCSSGRTTGLFAHISKIIFSAVAGRYASQLWLDMSDFSIRTSTGWKLRELSRSTDWTRGDNGINLLVLLERHQQRTGQTSSKWAAQL